MEKVIEFVNEYFNPSDGRTRNVANLAGAVLLVYAALKTKQMRAAILRSSHFKSVPRIQGIPIAGTAKPGIATAIYRNHAKQHPQPLDAAPWQHVNTMHDNFFRSVQRFGARECLGTRSGASKDGPYVWQSYDEVAERAKCFGSGLLRLCEGHLPRQGFVGLYAINRAEWTMCQIGLHCYSLVSVPLYDTLGVDAVEFIANQTEMTAMVCSAATLGRVLELIGEGKLPALRCVVSMDPVSPEQRCAASSGAAAAANVLYSLDEVEALGRRPSVARAVEPPLAGDMAVLCYSSGTTGQPKGCILTHLSLLAMLANLNVLMPGMLSESDVHCSYLPSAHVFELCVQVTVLGYGGAIGFFGGDILRLIDDVQTLRPTLFPSVPRLFNRLYDQVMTSMASGSALKRRLFALAYEQKRRLLTETGAVAHPLWDALVFAKVAAALGGRVRWMVTGSAPIAPAVLEFLRIGFSCHVVEGYGLSESAASGTVTLLGDVRADGTVGPPSPISEVRLVSVPELSYSVDDTPYPRGEVCLRGPSTFAGYYRMPQKTAEVFDDDGFFHTGDIGVLLPNGTFRIIDRVKSIFKLAQGEYLSPGKLENVAQQSNFVAQAFVFGDSLQTCVVLIAVPDEPFVLEWARAHRRPHADDFAWLCANDTLLRDELLADVVRVSREEAKLHGFEIVKGAHLCPEPFSVDNGLITPTFKLKRKPCELRFRADIDRLYQEIANRGGNSVVSRL
jgi:long-chain acyl-CoA synthetase